METNVKAREDGKVTEIFVKEGQQVQQGALLLVLA